MLGRGASRRCPRCGSGRVFRGWFRLVERCPRCDYLFAREEGFFLGAFVINFGVTIAGLAVVMAVLISLLATGASGQALVIAGAAAAAEAVVVPIVFYPLSKTIWAAIDLAMHRGEPWAAAPDPTLS